MTRGVTQRRLRHGLRWKTDKPPGICWKVWGCRIGWGLVILLGMLVIAACEQRQLLEQSVEQHKGAAFRYSRMLAECLNGGGLYDSAGKQGLFCGRAIVVKY